VCAVREWPICSSPPRVGPAWLTNGIRIELHHQGALVAVHASFIDTDMAALVDASKGSPESVAQQAFDAVEAGEIEVLADERSRFVKASLSRDHEPIYPPVQAFLMLRSRAPSSASGRGGDAGGRGVKAVPGQVMLAAPEQRHTAVSRRQLGGGTEA